MTYDAVTLPAVPASAARRAELLADGYAESRVRDVLTYRKRSSDVSTGDATGTALPRVSDTEREAEPVTLADALSDLVGANPAAALVHAGYPSAEAARAALDADPDAFASTPGVGKATVAKLLA